MIQHYLKVALRNLLKNKVQTIISIVGLSVGLLCFSICLYCSRFIEGINTSFTHYEQLAEVHIIQDEGLFSGTPATLGEELSRLSINEVEAVSRIVYPDERSYNVEINETKELPYTFNTIEVDSTYRRLFTPVVLFGSWEVAAQLPNSIVLTASTARTVFGGNNPIGRQMVLSSKLPTSPDSTPHSGGIAYTIHAVIEDLPTNTSMNFMEKVDMLTMNDSEGLLNSAWRKDMTGANTYLLLSPGKNTADVNERLKALNYSSELFGTKNSVVVSSIGEVFKRQSVANYFSLVTGVVGILILLAGLLNFFHFQIGSFYNRIHEYSIRKVVGSSKWQLFSMLLMQLLLILSFSFLLLFCLIELLSPYLQISLLRFTLAIDPHVLIIHAIEYFTLLMVLCVLLSMLMAHRVSHISVQVGIRGNSKRGGKHRMRNVMLGIQFFICWIFIAFTFALYLQADKTGNMLFGTLTRQEKASMLSVPLNYSFLTNEEKLELISRFGKCAGVKEVLVSNEAYTQGVSNTSISLEKDNKESAVEVNLMYVAPNFFTFMNIGITQGRTLKTGQEMLVNKALIDTQKEDVMGRMLYRYTDAFTVCGVCETFFADVYNQSTGVIFLPMSESNSINHCYIKCYPDREKEVVEWLNKMQQEVLPENIVPHVSTLLQDIEKAQGLENTLKGIILFFSIVCTIITLLGVYAAITLDTEQRQKEVAIRKVNGAGTGKIIVLFARLYLILLSVTALIAFPVIAVVLTLWKRMYTVFFHYGILFWSAIFVVVAALIAVTVLYRILKISRLNPADIIKIE